MQYRRVSELAFRIYYDRLFHRVSPREPNPEGAEQDYWNVHDSIQSGLKNLGGVCNSLNGNFVMNEYAAGARWIAVELQECDKMVSKKLLPTIADALPLAGPLFVVYLTHADIQHPLFHILIEKHLATAEGDITECLKTLGFH